MDIFTTDNCTTGYNYAGETLATVDHDGFTFTLSLEADHDHGAPWDEECGHGPVTDWATRDKLPGELILNDDGRSKQFYDFAEACRIARRDDWGYMPYRIDIAPDESQREAYTACGGHAHAIDKRTGETVFSAYDPGNFNRAISDVYAQHRATYPSARAYAAAAARADFDNFKAWCDDEWSYVGAIVTVKRNGIELATASLWGIESTAGDYFCEVGNELAEQALEEARAAIEALVE